MPGMVRLPGAQLNLVLSFSQGRELICSLVRCWGKAGLQTLAPGEPRRRREHGRAVDKKSLLLPSRAVLLQALTVFIALSKSPRARFRVVQLSLKGKCTVLALLALLTSWKMRFLSGKEPAGKYSSQSVLSSEPRAKPGTWKLCLGSLVPIICPNSSSLVQAVSETHKAWPENLLFNGIDRVVASCFI